MEKSFRLWLNEVDVPAGTRLPAGSDVTQAYTPHPAQSTSVNNNGHVVGPGFPQHSDTQVQQLIQQLYQTRSQLHDLAGQITQRLDQTRQLTHELTGKIMQNPIWKKYPQFKQPCVQHMYGATKGLEAIRQAWLKQMTNVVDSLGKAHAILLADPAQDVD